MKQSTRNFQLYKKLWKSHDPKNVSATSDDLNSDESALIDEICFKADLCEHYEEYIQTLCNGMILLLEAGITKRSLQQHPVLQEKIHNMGDKILENSYLKSDQFYVGLFVKLRVKFDWLQAKFYKVIKNMMHHVLDCGLKISLNIKLKIEEQLKSQDYKLYQSFFIQTHKLRAF